ncbi:MULTISPECIES: hypothetical protein [Pseudomonas]|uniref:hypothetical protein n=1 Tax=Pseudomonas TaxID=286 RepID=UPI0019D3074F|nr:MULTISPECIES: hypothetical protein [Pseudomonas]MCE0910220.1 hypothetical protein [Pseudomonas kurunegalensis]WJR54159.1 hypothetical protein LU664_017545 [Pseudomonas kurunegalensis]
MTSWNAFYERTNTRAPSLLLSCAIDHAKHLHPLHAVDLGCGAVNETLQMIQAGWQVLAIDTGDGNWVSRDFVQSLVGAGLLTLRPITGVKVDGNQIHHSNHDSDEGHEVDLITKHHFVPPILSRLYERGAFAVCDNPKPFTPLTYA